MALLRPAIPADWTVIVLADRGLYAKWLYQGIVACGWHPFLRINLQGQFRPSHSSRFRPLRQAARLDGLTHRWAVVCFKTRAAQLRWTLLARCRRLQMRFYGS
ncbi:MAG TPA: hypothetical protein VHO69_18060, partial [Phototrophicaceae bacterium]|nr:hypothetical protein [Phototrophicaceae bacterium]